MNIHAASRCRAQGTKSRGQSLVPGIDTKQKENLQHAPSTAAAATVAVAFFIFFNMI